MTDTPRKPIWTRKRCAEEYLRRTGRPPLDDARLGWALAVRAHIHEQALRGFANVGRARPVGVSADWPDWVTVGVGALRPAFDAYCAVDFGWVLLLEWPKIALDLGVLGDGLRADVAKRAEGIEAVERARRELDVSRGARAKDEEKRAFFRGVSMRRPDVTAAELNRLAIVVGLEPEPMNPESSRRRWMERMTRWALSPEERDRLAELADVDSLLDARPSTPISDLHAPDGP
jgi:hypothetical protein